jgi:thiopurine S-methyltransferase
MQSEFWHERWQRNEIGFHEGRVNAYLKTFWPQVCEASGQRVLVPLCGKSVDLAWLAERGHAVVGVELSELACCAFFAEHQLEPEISSRGGFQIFSAGPIALLCGDFFALTPALMGPVSLVYDRAALIALPPELRPRYSQHLTDLLPAGARGLMITLDYPDQDFSGPPFAVPDTEVKADLGSGFDLDRCHHAPLKSANPLLARGLQEASESVFVLQRRAG